MNWYNLPVLLAVGVAAVAQQAHAHGYAGEHMFISTLLIDDPNVADKASLPTFSYLPGPREDAGTSIEYGLGVEFSKTITHHFGSPLDSGYSWLTRPGDKTANGWENLTVGLKYVPYVNDPHEFMVSFGVQ